MSIAGCTTLTESSDELSSSCHSSERSYASRYGYTKSAAAECLKQADADVGLTYKTVESMSSLTPATCSCCTIGQLLKSFAMFTLAFSLAEAAEVASISLASKMFGRAGSLSVSMLYLTFAFGTLFANRVVKGSDNLLKPALLCGQLGLIPLHVTCLHAVLSDVNTAFSSTDSISLQDVQVQVSLFSTLLLVSAAALTGVGVGIAWAAAGAFITKMALAIDSSSNHRMHASNLDHAPAPDALPPSPNSTANKLGTFMELENHPTQTTHSILNTLQRYLCLPCLHTDFHSLAGTLSGAFNVILLVTLLGGHLFTYYALRVDDYRHVRNTYIIILAVSLCATLMMIFGVQDPILESDKDDEIIHEEVQRTHSHPHQDQDQIQYDHHQQNIHQNQPSTLVATSPPSSETDTSSTATHPNHSTNTCNHHDPSSPLYAFYITIQSPHLRALIGTHLASGFMEGLTLCYVGGTLISRPSDIGFLTTIRSIASTLAMPLFAAWGNASEGFMGRVYVLLVGAVAYGMVGVLTCWQFLVVHGYAHHSSLEGGGDEDDVAQSHDGPSILVPLYLVSGIAFATWQGTAGGALLSEIAASIPSPQTSASGMAPKRENQSFHSSNSVATAAFSGCKAISGAATAVAFFLFSNDHVPFGAIMFVCFSSLLLGLGQLLRGWYDGLWRNLGGAEVHVDVDADADVNVDGMVLDTVDDPCTEDYANDFRLNNLTNKAPARLDQYDHDNFDELEKKNRRSNFHILGGKEPCQRRDSSSMYKKVDNQDDSGGSIV